MMFGVEVEERAVGPSTARRNAYNMGRVFAFSDGVFAIAITLLVLSIPIPSLREAATNGEIWSALINDSFGLIGLAISLYVVGMQWMVHHRLPRYVERIDVRVLWLNLLLLLFICLVPFSTGVLVRFGDGALALNVCATNVAAAQLAFSGLWLYLHRHRQLLDPVATPATPLMFARPLTPAAVFLVSMPLG